MNNNDLPEAVKLLLESSTKSQRLACYKWLGNHLDEEVSRELGATVREIELKGGAQSKAFMVALLPKIWAHMQNYPRGTAFNILDVGPGAGFGSELLASIHAGRFIGYTAAVSAVDIRDTYFETMRYRLPLIREQIKKDIYKLDRTYDIVICSHVIEHVSEPVGFVKRLQELARQKVFLLTPWKEDPERLTKGHIHIFDEDFTSKFSDAECELMESIAWGAFMEPRYKMLYMALPGTARPAEQ